MKLKALKILENNTVLKKEYLREAIAELKELIEKDKSKKCEECYIESNKVLALVEQRECDAKHTIIKLTRELEQLENRKCENCKFGTTYLGTDRKWCEESIKQDGMTTVDKDFYCKRWQIK